MESKSARMRQLFAQGNSVSMVAKLVGVDYQFAYGVAKRAGFLKGVPLYPANGVSQTPRFRMWMSKPTSGRI